MPLGVKIKIFFILLLYVSLIICTLILSSIHNPLLIIIPIIMILIGLYILFIFYPKFDPTGFTLCRLKSRGKEIAITFDDGPDPIITPLILDILKENSIKAIFFCLGSKAERFPEIVERIRAEGHILGNHGYSHKKLNTKSYSFIKDEIKRSEKSLMPLTVVNGKKLFRAPHGFKNFFLIKALKEENYRLIGWTRGIWDTDGSSSDVLIKRAMDYLEEGVIFLLHDGRDIEGSGINTVEFLRQFIPLVRSRGYNFTNNL